MVRRPGFSLIELVIVVVIMAVIAAIALPRVSSASERAAFGAQHASFLRIERALHLYYADYGAFPPNTDQGDWPDELAPYLRGNPHEIEPPLGGEWDWNGEGTTLDDHGLNLSIVLTPPPDDRWLAFDVAHDDGSTYTGAYRRQNDHLLRVITPP